MKPFAFTVLIINLVLMGCAPGAASEDLESPYVGRFRHSEDRVINVWLVDSSLAIRPSMWRNKQLLKQVGTDSFQMLLHSDIQVWFERDSMGQIEALSVSNHKELAGRSEKMGLEDTLAVEFLELGKIDRARTLLKNPGVDRITGLGFRLLSNYPTQTRDWIQFCQAYVTEFPESAELQQILGIGSVMSGDRKNAIRYLETANALNPSDPMTRTALQLLGSDKVEKKTGWELPFDLEELFAPPTPTEIDQVWQDWATRDLEARNVEVLDTMSYRQGDLSYKVIVLTYQAGGIDQSAILLVPDLHEVKNLPVVIEVRGVDPFYSPIDLDETEIPDILQLSEQLAVVAIPVLRGNTIIVEDKKITSGGSPVDAWDGAADDAISILNAISKVRGPWDTTRVAIFGKSRGGTVALLAGLRDDRFKAVVNWAGPVEWFTSNMGSFGFSMKEMVQWGLIEKWVPGQGFGSSGQLIEQVLKETIETQSGSIKEVRQALIARSPYYFMGRLPESQHHYGINDRSVSVGNARSVEQLIDSLSLHNQQVRVHKTGHDQPFPEAYELSGQFLIKYLSE